MIRAPHLAGLLTLLSAVACSSATPTTGDGSTNQPSSKDSKSPSDSKDSKDSNPREPGPSDPTPSDPAPTEPSGADLGGICTKDGECNSNLCVFKGSSPRGICTKQCNNVTDCPGGYTQWDDCGEVGNVTGKVCIPKT
jgi:hypothetical protein